MRRGIKRLMPRPEGSPYTYTYTYTYEQRQKWRASSQQCKQFMQASLNTLLATAALYFYDAVTIFDKKAR